MQAKDEQAQSIQRYQAHIAVSQQVWRLAPGATEFQLLLKIGIY